MSINRSSGMYSKGLDANLDKKLAEYEKLRIWSGDGYKIVLSESEQDIMLNLWKKERELPRRMTVKEWSTLMVVFL